MTTLTWDDLQGSSQFPPRVGTVLRVERTVCEAPAPPALRLAQLVGGVVPLLLLAALGFVGWQLLPEVTAAWEQWRARPETGVVLTALVAVGIPLFLAQMFHQGMNGGDQTPGRWRRWRKPDRRPEPPPLLFRTVELVEDSGARFAFTVCGELVQGVLAPGHTLEVSWPEGSGSPPRRVWNRTTGTEVRWTRPES